jgi:hypothetical protein
VLVWGRQGDCCRSGSWRRQHRRRRRHGGPTSRLPALLAYLAASPACLQHRLKQLVPSPTGVQSLAAWGACAGITALWLTQPFDLIKKTLGLGEPK